MTDLADPATVDYVRDQWGRPLIVPPGGGKPVPYTRSSSAAKTVEDTYNLEMWARRNIAYGMAHDQSLVARVLALGGTPYTWSDEARKAVNTIHEAAAAVALAHKGADIGTAVHTMTERVDRGEQFDAGIYTDDLNAYVAALIGAGLVTHPAWVECRLVCDELEMAGTADRILTAVDGRRLIADIKTGKDVIYGGLGWAAQLACYAHGHLYDVESGERLDTPPLDRTTGIIVHIPAGQGRCDLYEIDLVAGYRAAQLANEIRSVRRASRRWIGPLPSVPAQAPGAPVEASGEHCRTCGAAIEWALTEKGKRIPLNPGSHDNGNLVVGADGVARSTDERPARLSHFATCPQADEHRKTNVVTLTGRPDRRTRLLERYRALHPARAARFRARNIDRDDLDAIEEALDDLTKPKQVIDGRLNSPVVSDLSLRVMAITPEGRAVLDVIAREAFEGPGPISYRFEPHERNVHVCRALVAMCEHGWDEVRFRELCAMATDDDAVEHAGVSLAETLALMSTEEAAVLDTMTAALGD